MSNPLSSRLEKGQFFWRRVYHKTLMLRNVQIVGSIESCDKHVECTLQLDPSHQRQIHQVEACIIDNLGNEYLKSECTPESRLRGRLHIHRKKILTTIYDPQDRPCTYSDVPENGRVDIKITMDSIWSHRNYYPNYVYKWKVNEIYALEKVVSVGSNPAG